MAANARQLSSASSIHKFIAHFAAYFIPASLDLIMDDLQAIANVPVSDS
jgi:hypothetical protein